MKTLITGASGFIGSHLAERLRQSGHQVTCISKDSLNSDVLDAAGCRIVRGDLNDGVAWDSALDGIEMVYHVAGVTRCRHPRDYYEGNHLATRNFLRACSTYARNIQRFLYVSSLSAVGPSVDGRPVSESTPYHPVSHYGKSKMRAELEVLNVREKLPITIVRPSAVYGPRERDMFDYIKLIERGIELLIGFGEKFLSLIYCDDLVDGIIRAAESRATCGKTYFLSSESYYSETELGETIAKVVASHPIKVHLPHAAVFAVGAASAAIAKVTRSQSFFNLEKARESVQHSWTCSVENAIRDFGFHPHVGLEEGMRRSYAWYRMKGWL